MKLGQRRPLKAYFFRLVWISIMISWLITNSTVFGRWTIGALTAIGTMSLITMIVRKNYFEIIGDKLIINRDFFRTQTVDLTDIVKIDIEPRPFISSKIILKNQSVIKYMDDQLDDNELRQLFGQLNIPVG